MGESEGTTVRAVWYLAAISLTVAFCGATAFADTVFLKSGIEVEGTVTEETRDTVQIRTSSGGMRSFRRSDVDAVVRDASNRAPAGAALPPVHVPEVKAPPVVQPVIPSTPPAASPEPSGEAPESSLNWLESMDEALATAKKTNKPVLANFTGTDWCFFCKKLEKEVFATKDFEKWSEDFVLLRLDFPRKKAQSAEIKKQNLELAQKFDITGYPTVVILTPQGNEMGRKTGFAEKTPQEWFAHVSAALKK